MIFFTGSAATGKRVAQAAAVRLVPAVLELGGKSPMIVLADADLRRAAHAAVWSGFANSGQVCIRTERVIVEDAVADRFVELAAAEIAQLRQGPPPLGKPDAATSTSAPSTFAPQIEQAQQHIADARARGGRIVTGGARRADLPGQLLRADADRRRDARHGGDARGDLRPRAAGDARPRRGGGAARSRTTRRWGFRAASGRATPGAPARWRAGCRPAASASTTCW